MKAIETKYKGYKFRSRLEARWAKFFDAMDEQWEYEKEGYDLDGIWYLPDFWLPRFNCFVEVKGLEPTEAELSKARLLRDGGSAGIAIFQGLPTEYQGMLFGWDISDSSGGSSEWSTILCNTGDGDLAFGIIGFRDRSFFTSVAMDEPWERDVQYFTGKWFPTARVDICLDECKAARFEYGESG